MNIQTRYNIYSLKNDLNTLYLNTKDKRVEDLFVIAARASENLESNMLKWIRNVLKNSRQTKLNRQEVWETIIVLQDIRKNYPLGVNKAIFAYMVAEDKRLQSYISMIHMFDTIQQGRGLEILKPYEDILSNSRIAQQKGFASISQEEVEKSLDILENDYKTFNSQKNREQQFEEMSGYKRKLTKSDLIRSLSAYLARRFATEISEAFNQLKIMDIAGISADPSVLRDPIRIIQEVFQNDYEPILLRIAKEQADEIVKGVIPFLDPMYYDHVYNYIRNKVLKESGMMSSDDFNKYIYRAQLGLPDIQEKTNTTKLLKTKKEENEMDIPEEEIPEEAHEKETISHNVVPNAWINPETLVLLSCVLYTLYTKIK
jgi:hypothetical protein